MSIIVGKTVIVGQTARMNTAHVLLLLTSHLISITVLRYSKINKNAKILQNIYKSWRWLPSRYNIPKKISLIKPC